ncbi:MAG: 50S ribosomal protein L17 [Candidatus Krumholzibacteria bacterium]|nr:50S ribosomal protein L17 [Candidatus Krumholzibacteria bacterium]
MRHNNDHRKLGRTAAHRKAMLSNMVTSLFKAERITTTVPRAKEARRLAERMITFARRGDLAARRHVARTVKDPAVLRKLFDDIGPRYAGRPGGYTRVLKAGMRHGDAAPAAILELVGKDEKPRGKKKTSRKTYHDVEVPESPLKAHAKKKAAKKKAEEKQAAEAAAAAEQAAAATEGASPEGDVKA